MSKNVKIQGESSSGEVGSNRGEWSRSFDSTIKPESPNRPRTFFSIPKPRLNYFEQVLHLENYYGLVIKSQEERKRIISVLRRTNYYRLCGYWITLLDNDSFKIRYTIIHTLPCIKRKWVTSFIKYINKSKIKLVCLVF